MQKVRTLPLCVWPAGGQPRPPWKLVRKADPQSPARGCRSAIRSLKLLNFGETVLYHVFKAANSTTVS